MRAREFDNPKDTFVEMFSKFLPIAMKVIGLKSLPKMIFEKEVESPDQPTFGQYVNGDHVLYVGLANRHPNDILRTMAHELVHYKQDTEHQLDGESGMTGSPEENQANAVAGVVMRHFNKQYPEYLKTKPIVAETWSDKYKRSINCANPKGFSQRAHCQGRKKNENQNVDDRDSMFYGGRNDPDGPRTHQDYRVTDKINWSHPELTTGMKYRIRSDANRIPAGIKGLAATEKFYRDYAKYLLPHHKADVKRESAGDRGDIPTGPGEQLIPFPQGTTMVDVSDVYDWYKLGMVISDLDDADPKIFGQGAPHTVIAFGSEEEHKLLPLLKRLGLSVHDIDRPEDVKKVIPAKMLAKDIAETIRKVGSQYRLVSKSGRNLGTYPTHAGAEKRERQVQYFKHVGEAESFDNEANAWKKWQLDHLDAKMKMLSRLTKGWIPSEEDHRAAIEAGYIAMKETGNVKDAARAISDKFIEIQRQQGLLEGFGEINWVKPNFDFEWHEVEEQSKMKQVPIEVRQYYQKHFPNKEAWLKSVQNGKVVVINPDHNFEIRNAPHDKQSLLQVLAPTGHEGPIGPAKAKRVNALFDKGGPIEMPIILKTNKSLWLIGGKTRLGTANYIKGIPAKVWMIGGEQGVAENFADGRNPQDKGDSSRHGIRKGMTIAQLKKIRSSDSASPRKKQLAHWQINMRQGHKK